MGLFLNKYLFILAFNVQYFTTDLDCSSYIIGLTALVLTCPAIQKDFHMCIQTWPTVAILAAAPVSCLRPVLGGEPILSA